MQYFVISDIHGFYDAMIESLTKAGYDSDNPDHHLIVLGDLFDRGPNSKEVYQYLRPLEETGKATILTGNHDTFLLEFLEGDFTSSYFNMLYNGFHMTLLSFTGIEPTKDNFPDILEYFEREYPDLYSWLGMHPYYYELGDYIFVHGGIDGAKLDWKTMSSPDEFIWGREHQLPRVEGKTVVAGHTRVATLRRNTNNYHLLYLQHPEDFDILYLEGKILIDRYVEVSGELNVLTLTI